MAKRNSLAYSLTHNKNVNSIENERTKKQYVEKIRMFARFLKEECGVKRMEQVDLDRIGVHNKQSSEH